MQEANEETYDDSITTSQETLKIKNSSMIRKTAFPIHEEYKLQKARIEYTLDVNMFCNEVLNDMKISKMCDFQECVKRGIFLKQNEEVVRDLKRRRRTFVERSNRFLDESFRQLKILNKNGHTFVNEAHDIGKDLNALPKNMEN